MPKKLDFSNHKASPSPLHSSIHWNMYVCRTITAVDHEPPLFPVFPIGKGYQKFSKLMNFFIGWNFPSPCTHHRIGLFFQQQVCWTDKKVGVDFKCGAYIKMKIFFRKYILAGKLLARDGFSSHWKYNHSKYILPKLKNIR